MAQARTCCHLSAMDNQQVSLMESGGILSGAY